jgi:hypothetical protein
MTAPSARGASAGPSRWTGVPGRLVLVGLTGLTSIAGIAGAVQLAAGVATPPVTVLPFGLSSWLLPGLWLFASVGVPSGIAAVLTWRRSPNALLAASVGAAALLVELAVQIPFVGLDVLQAVFAADAAAMVASAIGLRRAGWPTASIR